MTSEIDAQSDIPHGVRLRFRATKGVTTDDDEIAINLGGRPAKIVSPDKKPLKEGGWLAIRSSGFSSFAEASSYGNRLKTALLISSVRLFWGVDVGEGKATSMFFKGITDQWEKEGKFVRPNVHGLDVYPERDGTFWAGFSGRAYVSMNPAELESELNRMVSLVPESEPSIIDAIVLMNEALISVEPAAQLVLALAAVEMLAQGENWTSSQRDALERLARAAENDSALRPDEQSEITQSIRRSLHRMGVRQALKRLLSSLGLEELWRPFDDLYGRRSALLHGLSYATPADRQQLVVPTLQLCGRIVLSALESEVPGVLDGIDARYPKAPTI